jgi:hypothetical protein
MRHSKITSKGQVNDITDSAGSLSKFADADELIRTLLRERKRSYF